MYNLSKSLLILRDLESFFVGILYFVSHPFIYFVNRSMSKMISSLFLGRQI